MDTRSDAVALRYLRYLALREGGYTRLGVPGWALRQDVEAATGLRLPERLPVLHRRGLLDREDVRAPGLSRPAWIYRISQAGADRVAERADLPRRPVLRPLRLAERDTDAAILVPPGAALALRELRRAAETRVESPRLPGEPGWQGIQDLASRPGGGDEPPGLWCAWERSGGGEEPDTPEPRGEPWTASGGWTDAEVCGEGEGWDPLCGGMPPATAGRAPQPGDLEWLVRAGLAQRWTARGPGRRAVPLFRITALGGVAIPLEWRVPR